jgi:hypothetical protein
MSLKDDSAMMYVSHQFSEQQLCYDITLSGPDIISASNIKGRAKIETVTRIYSHTMSFNHIEPTVFRDTILATKDCAHLNLHASTK